VGNVLAPNQTGGVTLSDTAGQNLHALNVTVRSKILDRISGALDNADLVNADTQYTKSDGTNYGMYQKSGDVGQLTDIWQVVFNQNAIAPNIAAGPAAPAAGTGSA
jgi:hypothetical protein